MSQRDNFWDGDLSDISDSELDLPDPSSFLELKSSPEMPDDKRARQKRKPGQEATPAIEDTQLSSPTKKMRSSAETAKQSSNKQSTSLVKSDLTAINSEYSFVKEAQNKTDSRQHASASPVSDTNAPSSLSLITTGLTDAQLKRLRKSAVQLSECLSVTIAVHTEVSCSKHKLPIYTHLVTSVGKDGRTARTYKYLAGIASGAKAVKVEWMFESAKKGTLLPVDRYLITGDTAMRGCSLAPNIERGKLLAGYNICVWKGKWDAGSAHTHEELLSLICTLGAKLIDKVPKDEIPVSDNASLEIGPSAAKFAATVPVMYRDMFTKPTHNIKTVILVDPDTIKGTKGHSVLDDITHQTAGAYPCRTKSWLFDCVSANKVL
ncbi:hypothetical protein GGI05_005688 [Coemansia sp. RSA 2603]|nr:hypothetical protein GGI05_005688 [Coemansia sp. RSA 2603]